MPLRSRRILVVEDEYLLALDLRGTLEDAGAVVLGPAPSVSSALALVEAGTPIDAALLDVNLNGEMVFPVADALCSRSIPFIFTSGYDSGAIADRYKAAPHCPKPLEMRRIVTALSDLLNS